MTKKEAEVELRKTFINKNVDFVTQKIQNNLLDIILMKDREESPFIKPTIEKINFFLDNTKKRPKYIMHFLIRGVMVTYDFPIQVNKKTWLAYKTFWEGKFSV